jgi:Uma2 family endonuclease
MLSCRERCLIPEPAAMTAARKLPPMMTVDDFLGWEGDGTDTRYELVDGVLRAMSPTMPTHGVIQANLIAALHAHLGATAPRCRVVTAPGIRPLVRADWNYRIPDIGVTCTPIQVGDRMLTEPRLLIEVLSPGNAADTYENIRAYASIPSVEELIVVHSTRIEIEFLRKGEHNIWPANPTLLKAGSVLQLASVGLTLPVANVYEGTHLGA